MLKTILHGHMTEKIAFEVRPKKGKKFLKSTVWIVAFREIESLLHFLQEQFIEFPMKLLFFNDSVKDGFSNFL